MDVNYLEVLDKKNEELKSVTDSYKRVIDTLTYIESFIPEFFSKDGEERGIRKMYKDIRVAMESSSLNNEVPCIDIHHGHYIYKEYLEGMSSFINDINALDEDTELPEFEEKLTTARSNDSAFVKSLYGGSLNAVESASLADATSNIEFLVDFIPDISKFKETCESYHNYDTESESPKNTLLKESTEMLYDSISDYCYNAIKNVVSTYESIQKVLSGESIIQESEEEKVPFVLF